MLDNVVFESNVLDDDMRVERKHSVVRQSSLNTSSESFMVLCPLLAGFSPGGAFLHKRSGESLNSTRGQKLRRSVVKL